MALSTREKTGLVLMVLGLVVALVGAGIYLFGGSAIIGGVCALVAVAMFVVGERLVLRRGPSRSG